jgi:hypothetical protein
MFRLPLIATGALALATTTLVLPAGGGKDFTTLPPASAEVKAQIDGSKVTLAQAIELASKQTGGSAKSAEMTMVEGQPVFDVMVYGPEKAQKVRIDGSGNVGTVTEVPRFPGDPVKGQVVTTPSGLQYYDIKVGDGAKPTGPTSYVTVHYTGWLVDGHQFDSSVGGKPITFPLNGVIGGWTEGVGSMAVGGKRKLLIPYNLAYGEMGRPGIPGRATLIFDVELLDTKDGK